MGNYKLLNDEQYDFKAYNTLKNSITPDIIHIKASGSFEKDLGSSSKDGILLEISDALNSDDEIVKKLSIRTFADGVKEYEILSNQKTDQALEKMDVGDYVLYNLNAKGNITNIDSAFFTKTMEQNKADNMNNILSDSISFFSSSFEIQIGYAFNKENEFFGMSETYPSNQNMPEGIKFYKNITTGNRPTQIYIVDTKKKKSSERVREADWSELRDYLRYGTADRVLAKFVHTDLGTLVIYR